MPGFDDNPKWTQIRYQVFDSEKCTGKFGQQSLAKSGITRLACQVDGDWKTQSLRFDKKKFTMEQARTWVKSHPDLKAGKFPYNMALTYHFNSDGEMVVDSMAGSPPDEIDYEKAMEYYEGLREIDPDGGEHIESKAPIPFELVPFKIEQGIPKEVLLPGPGEYEHKKYGKFFITEESIRRMVEKFNAEENDKVFDYEHATLKDKEAPAAGWIKKLVDRGSKGFFAVIEWTKKAKDYIKSGEYKFFSPVYYLDKKTKIADELHSMGLTNVPALDGYPLANRVDGVKHKKEDEVDSKILVLLGLTEDDSSDEKILGKLTALQEELKTKTDEAGKLDKLVAKKEALEALGLKEDATLEELKKKVETLKKDPTKSGDFVELATFKALETSYNETSKALTTITDELATNKRDAMIQQGLDSGKLTAAMAKDWANDYAKEHPEGFALFLDKAPVLVEMKEVTPPGRKRMEEDGGKLDQRAKAIMKEDKTISYGTALSQAGREMPDEAGRYLAEQRKAQQNRPSE